MLDHVAELNPLDDFGQAARTVEFAQFLLGRQHQLVGHRQRRLAAEAAFGLGGSVPDGAGRWQMCGSSGSSSGCACQGSAGKS